jgi:hypothetical protein
MHRIRLFAPLQRFAWTLGVGLLAVALPLSTALAQTTDESTATPALWTVLLPLLASAVAVERAVEIVWNYIDWMLLNVRGWQPADLRATQYVQFKSGTSLVLGIILGVVISNYTGMRLFDYLRPLAPRLLETVPPVWDVLITGFIIGAGTKPTHDLLGIITQTKNLLGSAAIKQREAAGAMLADAVLKLAQSDAQALIDVPGVGPARLAQPNQPRGDDDEPILSPISSTEQYIQTIHQRTSL